jgi:hypothetical protein
MSNKVVQEARDPFEIYDFDSGLKLLHEYSGIPDEDVRNHVELIVSNKHYHLSMFIQLTFNSKQKPCKW